MLDEGQRGKACDYTDKKLGILPSKLLGQTTFEKDNNMVLVAVARQEKRLEQLPREFESLINQVFAK